MKLHVVRQRKHDLSPAENDFRQFPAGTLPACRIYFSIRQQQQVDGLPAGNHILSWQSCRAPSSRHLSGSS